VPGWSNKLRLFDFARVSSGMGMREGESAVSAIVDLRVFAVSSLYLDNLNAILFLESSFRCQLS
jgi:hypothetical protein